MNIHDNFLCNQTILAAHCQYPSNVSKTISASQYRTSRFAKYAAKIYLTIQSGISGTYKIRFAEKMVIAIVQKRASSPTIPTFKRKLRKLRYFFITLVFLRLTACVRMPLLPLT